MDTMTATKVLGGFCGALLIYLLGNWAAEEIYHVGGGHGGEYASGYAIEVAEAEVEVDEMEEEGPQFAELYLAADIDKGSKVFGKCKACHKLEDGANGTGPHLWAVVDRVVGSVDGYGYSGALVAVAETWSCLLYTSPSPRDATLSRMPSSA